MSAIMISSKLAVKFWVGEEEAHTPQEAHWQLEPQLQEEGPVHWQGPILFDGDLILEKELVECVCIEVRKSTCDG